MKPKLQKLDIVTEEEFKTFNQFNQDITEEFLQQGHLSPQTLKQYDSALRQFFAWVKENCKNKSITDLKTRDALKYQNFLIGRGLSSSGVKLKRSAVSSLCCYIELYYSDEEDYPTFRNIYNNKIPSPPKSIVHEKQPPTPEELKMLLDTLKEKEDWQKVAYLEFSYSSGCRRTEASLLLKEDINNNVIKGKNYYRTSDIRCKGSGSVGDVRRLQFGEEAMESMKKWLEVRGEDDCPYMFVSKTKAGKTKRISPQTFNSWATEHFSKILGRRFVPHNIRASRATNLTVEDGKDIKSAQALLGHQSSTTTEIYVIRDSSEDIDDCFE